MPNAHAKPAKSSELRAMIALRFKAACNAYQPNQAALARALDIDPRQLNGYLKGKNYPDESVLVAFCQLSRCTMDWIFLGKMESIIPPTMAALMAVNAPELFQEAVPAAVVRHQEQEPDAEEPVPAPPKVSAPETRARRAKSRNASAPSP